MSVECHRYLSIPLMEGGSKWARLCGMVRATTDEIGAARSDRTTTKPTRNQREGNPL
jgi:hypothetical protein